MKSQYSSKTLFKQLRYLELKRHNLTVNDFKNILRSEVDLLKNGQFSFSLTKTNNHLKADNLAHTIILRRLNERLRKVYKDTQQDRRIILKQIVALLSDTSEYYILRTDVSSFYESINRDVLRQKILKDRILSFESIFLIDKLLDNPSVEPNGLPRGISISSTLSELYMREFDKQVKTSDGVFYYARFVDDIIVFVSSKAALESLRQNISSFLPNGLIINKKKTEHRSLAYLKQGKPFEYLGYSFTVEVENSNCFNPKVSIAKGKVKKIKSRIVSAVVDYCKTLDFELLKRRLDFLSCNYALRANQNSALMAGFYFNYEFVNDNVVLEDINRFYHKTISARRGSFGRRLQSVLTPDQYNELRKVSFKHRFHNKYKRKYTLLEINEIKSCWKHEG